MGMKDYHCMAFECDAPQCNQVEDFGVMNDEFIAPTKMECLEIARARGWMISHGRKTAKCWCATHAEERRANRYRPRKA